MRISWLQPDILRAAREWMLTVHPDWAAHFVPDFTPPPPPPGVDATAWPRIAEHVARAERVGQEIRSHGLDAALASYGGSRHAIEVATLAAAAIQVDRLSYDLLVSLLGCEVDDLIVYGPFLDLLQHMGRSEDDQGVAVYERFCAAFVATTSSAPMWEDRVRAIQDGLASFYVRTGRMDQGHELFAQRHDQDPDSLLVALSASRSFLAAGAVSRAVAWLGMGAERAERLGREDMAAKLRDKQIALKRRQS